MNKEIRQKLTPIIVAAVLLLMAWGVEKLFPGLKTWQLLLVYLVPYFVAGWEVLLEGAEKLLQGEPLDEDFLMGVATIGALAIAFMPEAEPQFTEAVFVMLFYRVGEFFEWLAEGRSRRSIAALMDIRPDTATVLRDGVEQVVDPSTVEIGEIILIKAGEKVPMDGEVIEGSSLLDTVALTGESVPRGVTAGDNVISGCVNLIGLLKVRVSKSFGESTAAKILDLVQNASEAKSKKEKFIRRFSRIYTPVVVGLAALVAIVPPVLAGIGVGGYDGAWATWIYRALCFLIVSCPCAFVISIPLSFFGGIGAASKHGILVKGSNYLEALARTSTTVFDKTGTLTEGVFELTAVHPLMDEKGLLHLVSHVEHNSIHPIAAALRDAFPCDSSDCSVSEVKEHPGMGVSALVNGSSVAVGDASLMRHVGADISSECEECKREGIVGTMVHVAINGDYVGHILISDRIKEDSSSAIKALRDVGISKIVMLTGDNEEVAGAVSKELGIDEYHAGLLPADKLSIVEGMLSQKNSLAFVGEGINDAPVLARADVGIAMGALGSDAAIEAADVVIMDDKPSKIVSAIRIARKTVRIATQNTWFAIGIKVVVLVLAFFGIAHMWLAVFADVGVTILCIFNAMRALSIRKV
jgi:Cd2+/Zn2+-exporting ATPase